jgi:integrase
MEVVALKVSDIDSKRMMLRVEQGKGRKDRFAMLSPQLLELLRDWWRIARPPMWMFPGRDRISQMSTRQLNRVCHMAAELAGLPTWVAPHTLRHSLDDKCKRFERALDRLDLFLDAPGSSYFRLRLIPTAAFSSGEAFQYPYLSDVSTKCANTSGVGI